MYEYLAEDAYKHSMKYRRKANKLAKKYDIPIETINQIVGNRMGQLYPTFFEDFEYRR